MSYLRPIKGNKKAVSEVIGTILILTISVSLFSVVYASFFSIDVSPSTPAVRIVGTISNNNLILDHKGGDMLKLDTKTILDYGNGDRREMKIDESNYMADASKSDGFWNIGENFKFDLAGLTGFNRFDPIDIMVVDVDSNSVVMMGTMTESRTADLELLYEIDEAFTKPSIGDKINFAVTVKNNGESYTDNVNVSIDIPPGLKYLSDDSGGKYDPNSKLWDVGFIDATDSYKINIEAGVVNLPGEVEFTQLTFIIDGSDNCTVWQWNSILAGLSNAVLNTIPHNNMVELTIVQYGNGCSAAAASPEPYPTAQLVLGPTVLTAGNFNQVATDILSITKMGGNCPMGAGFLKATDIIKASPNFNPDYKQVVCLIAAGVPDCYVRPDDEHIYKATIPKKFPYFYGKTAAGIRRDNMISDIQMTSDKDEINAMLLLSPFVLPGHNNPWDDPENVSWVCNDIAWPGSYYYDYGGMWPPEGSGWVRGVVNDADIQTCVEELISMVFTSRVITGEIENSLYMDPYLDNNEFEIIITPS